MTTETFVIKIQQTGAEAATAQMNRMGAAAQKTANIMGFFRKALVAFASVRIAQNMMEFADTAVLINNRLRVATKSAEDFARAQKFIFEVSKETRTGVMASAVVYSRLLQATSQLNMKTEDLEQIMENLNKSISIGGATTQEAKNSLIQFSQALASGALRGDELRSVSEQLPALANAIGKEFGVAKGQLLAFAKANPGILETEKVLRGVLKATEEFEAQFAATTPTMMNGITAISNGFIALLMEVQEGTGVFSALANGLIIVGNNMKAVITVLLILMAMKVYSFFATWAAGLLLTHGPMLRTIALTYQLVGAQGLLNIAILANPYVAAAVAIAAFVATLVTLYQTVPAVTEFFDGLWATVVSLATAVGTILSPAWEALKLAMSTVGPFLMAIGEAIGSVIYGWGLLVESFGAVVLAWTPLGLALQAAAPMLELLGYILVGVLVAGLSAVVLAMRGVTEVLYAFGAVSEETITKVRASSDAWLGYATTLVTSGLTVANAELQQKKLAESAAGVGTSSVKAAEGVAVFNDGMDATGRALENVSIVDRFGIVLETIAPAAERTGDSLTKTSDATVTLESVSGKAAETMQKLNPELFKGEESGAAAAQGFDDAGSAASRLTGKINALAEAYKRLNSVNGSIGTASDELSGKRAAGGPVFKGGSYLVGEKGPEIFVPNASGTIVPNDKAIAHVASGAAANDNTAPSSNKVVRAMVQAANSTAESANMVATALQKWTMVSYKDSKYAEVKGYEGDMSMEARAANGGEVTKYGGRIVAGNGYTRKDGTTPIFGDEDYIASAQFATRYSNSVRGAGVSTTGYDANKPGDLQVAQAMNAVAMGGNKDLLTQALANQEKFIQQLKDIRDNTAAFKEFKKTYDDQLGTPSGLDFQTLLPILGLGGKDMGEHDPYGLMKQNTQPAPAQSSSVAEDDSGSGGKKKKSGDTFNVVLNGVQDFQSFRNNRAQLEGNIYGMVKRAARRAGG